MAAQCTTCVHPYRDLIDLELGDPTRSVRGIARRHDLDPESLRRHLRGHLAVDVRSALEPPVAADIASRIVAIAEDARETREAALDAGQTQAGLRAGDAELRALVTLADRLGVRTGEAMAEFRSAVDLTRAVGAVARLDPRAGELIALQLTARGRTDLANEVRAEILKSTEREAIAS